MQKTIPESNRKIGKSYYRSKKRAKLRKESRKRMKKVKAKY
ncbi:hypothetical protein [Candidatus Mancarchaeum acidiphilum]|nr:hypothetical protein [Candidatus Mancarchaeum acidiphilum]